MPNGELPDAFLAALGRAGAWEMLPACPTVRTPTPITGAPRTPASGACAHCNTAKLPKTLATAGGSDPDRRPYDGRSSSRRS